MGATVSDAETGLGRSDIGLLRDGEKAPAPRFAYDAEMDRPDLR